MNNLSLHKLVQQANNIGQTVLVVQNNCSGIASGHCDEGVDRECSSDIDITGVSQ